VKIDARFGNKISTNNRPWRKISDSSVPQKDSRPYPDQFLAMLTSKAEEREQDPFNGLDSNPKKHPSGSAEPPQTKRSDAIDIEHVALQIARGEHVSSQKLAFLAEKAPHLYRAALDANEMRASLERKLRSASSPEEKQQLISEAMLTAASMSGSSFIKGIPDSSGGLLAKIYTEAVGVTHKNERVELSPQKPNPGFDVRL